MIRWFAFCLLLLFIYHVREVFPPFIVGGIIAYLLNPMVRWLCKSVSWLKPGLAIATIYFGFVATMGLMVWHFGPPLADQASNLFENRHETTESLVEQVTTQFGLANVDVKKTSNEILGSIEGAIGKPEELVHVGGIVSHTLLAVLVTIVSSIYFMLDSQRVGKFFLRFVPEDRRVTVVNLSSQMNVMLSKYVSGQLLLIIIMSTIAFIFLSMFSLKYALLIAIISGVLEIIPVLGPLLAISLATIMAIAQLGFSVAWAVPLCYWVARLVEDYFIVPNIVGHAVELHPLAVIFAVLVGETMAGALGMLIAIPVAASVKVILDFCYPPEGPTEHRKHEHANPFAWIENIFKSLQSPEPKQHSPHSGAHGGAHTHVTAHIDDAAESKEHGSSETRNHASDSASKSSNGDSGAGNVTDQ
ncbi:MAG TPA: AI-2E family transporter, partial [Chroococcales cyanobacterium]